MLVRDVGDDGDVEVAARHAVLGEAVRGDLEDAVREARGDHAGEVALHLGRVGRGDVEPGVERLIPDDGADGGDQPGFESGGGEDGVDERRGRGLAVRAGDADQHELARGEAMPCGGEPAEGGAGVRDSDVGNRGNPGTEGTRLSSFSSLSSPISRFFQRIRFSHYGRRAAGEGVRDEAVAVEVVAADGDE